MANASVLLEEEVLGHVLRLHAFKRSGPAVDVVLKELGEDSYRLRKVAAPPPGEPPVVIDIGASIGAVTVLLALLWPRAQILAVEPAPANYRYLLWNLRTNGVSDRVWPLNVAIGATSSASQAFFYSPTYPTWSQRADDDQPSGTAASGREPWRGGWTDWQVRFEVETATLAELLATARLADVHFLKVDCEGCEWGVFAPLSWDRLRHRVRHAAAELHRWALPGTDGDDKLEAAVRAAICEHEVQRENTLCSTM